ncbi:hypothetical protein [Kitasatospora brasiliensis]|uniref:hypothetical protein n=1 Tax=Kitasatospora brasiliensis TaxID=3058040 RepID=UPI00292DBC3D|nr:hypothetical protein [Kitasatospora sp. K002]
MSEPQQQTVDRAPADPDEPVCGNCRDCGQYGLGRYAGAADGLYDWITEHVGCRRPGARVVR